MDRRAPSFVFGPVPPSAADEAYAFHIGVAESDAHIWPRNKVQIQTLADEGELFGIRRAENRKFVGLCYALFDEDSNQWEVGGLTVTEEFRNLRLATVLTQLALAHTIAFESPFQNRHAIIAHVHQDNQAPRKLLERLGFTRHRQVRVPGIDAPPSMKRDADGFVTGDEFVFEKAGLCRLADWLDSITSIAGNFEIGSRKLQFDWALLRFSDIRQAVRSVAREFGDCNSKRE